MKSRIMIIGPRQSGKTTLANIINEVNEVAQQGTQDIRYGEFTMDMPSGYLETPWMYEYLIASAQDADVVFFLMDPTAKFRSYPPGFSQSFSGIHCGIITKCDLANDDEVNWAKGELEYIGITTNIFMSSAVTGEGISCLKEFKKYCTQRY